MEPENDLALAKLIANKLNGKFWQVTLGDWWVVVEGVSSQHLVVWTNDPFEISFTPKALNIGLQDLRKKVLRHLFEEGIVMEDGTWAHGGLN